MHRIFENSDSAWVNFTEYGYRLDAEGEEYIVATGESELKHYVPGNIPDLILIDSLNIGKMVAERMDTVTVKAAILDFCRHYGLLGFMTAFPLSLDFLGRKNVLLGDNILVGMGKKPRERGYMETQKYIRLFTPFGLTPDSRMRNLNSLFLDRAEVYDTVFTRDYAEKLDWVTEYFCDLYLHFNACYQIDDCGDNDLAYKYKKQIEDKRFAGIGYRLCYRQGQPPSLDYDFPSLKSVIDTAYSFSVTADPMPLKLCKDCGRVFFVNNQRTEFCTVQCRNKYNTRKFRAKG